MTVIIGDTANSDLSRRIKELAYIKKYADKQYIKISNLKEISLGAVCIDASQIAHIEEDNLLGFLNGFLYFKDGPLLKGANDLARLFNIILEDPKVLSKLNGSFLLVCTNGRRLIIATDRLAAKNCFYCHMPDRLIFGSEVKTLLPDMDNISVDQKGVGDMISFDMPINNRTYIKNVRSVPAATCLIWEANNIKMFNYFKFKFNISSQAASKKAYVSELFQAYEKSLEKILEDIGDFKRIGIFLSGGLDSRLLFGVMLRKKIDFTTISYDFNPSGGINTRIAKEISEKYGIKNLSVEFPYFLKDDPDLIEEAVWITDGLTPWRYMLNLDFDMKCLNRHVDTIITNMGQGEFFGEDLSKEELSSSRTPLEILKRSQRFINHTRHEKRIVYELLCKRYSISDELRTFIRKSPNKSSYCKLLEAIYALYYPNMYKGDVAANLVDLKSIFSNNRLLSIISNLPLSLRIKHCYPVSPLKIELIRYLGNDLADIEYERTLAKPKDSISRHCIGYRQKNIENRVYDFSDLIREDSIQRLTYDSINILVSNDVIDENVAYELTSQHMDRIADFGHILSGLATAGMFIKRLNIG